MSQHVNKMNRYSNKNSISGKKSEDSSKNKPHINNEHPEIKSFNEKPNNKNKDLKKVENKNKFAHSQLGPIEHKKREKEYTGNQNLDKNKEIKENKGTIGKLNIKSHTIKPEDSGNVHVTKTHIQIKSKQITNSTPNKTGNEPSNKPKVDKSIELKEGKVNKNLNKRNSEKNIDSNNDKNKNSHIPIKSRKSNDITNQTENKNNNPDNRLTQNNKNNKLNSLVDETNKNKKLENKENNEAILKQLKQLETEKEKYKTLLDEKNKDFTKISEENKILKENINKINKNLDGENIKNKDLEIKIKKLNEDNGHLTKEIENLKKINESKNNTIKTNINQNNIANFEHKLCQRSYDIGIRMESLNDLLNGWDITYGIEGTNKYLEMINKDILLIGILGLKNKGKSYFLSKLLNEDEYIKDENNILYLKYIINNEKKFNYAIIDTPGLGKYLKKSNEIFDNKKSIKELEKNNEQIDNFIINFVLKKSNFILCLVGLLDYNEQKLISKLKLKDEEYNKEFNQLKKIFIIHNLKEFSTKKEVFDYINNVLLKSLTFQLIQNEGNLAQNKALENTNTKYFIEDNCLENMEIYHLIIAKENTEAGNFYNEATYTFIIKQYNSFHSYNKFDLIREIKEEINLISKNILIKPIKSLDDFENSENKIKLKTGFEFLNNTDENISNDFSYLTLKPKYSFYKINNNTQLLIIIEIAGEINEQKLICSKKPKNGYYIITFSGKKTTYLPDNVVEQKKIGSFYSNIDIGEFKEKIKINIDHFQLKSTKYTNFESTKNGIYKYYFDLITNSENNDSDD